MKALVVILVAILVLWFPFSIASLLSIPVTFWAMFSNIDYARNLLRAQDKLAAALMGWSGYNTVSAECGARETTCKFCTILCKFLNVIQKGHCEGAAKNEGLI